MTPPTDATATGLKEAIALAVRFHETYERLAPSFGYETRPDTKAFDPETPNGRLMIAVCAALLPSASVGGEREALALRAIKAVTATAKDGPAGLSRIMAITSAAGIKAPYHELLTDPDVALIVEQPRTEWAHLFKPGIDGCVLPPETWRCTRTRGHSGPCATVPALAAPETPPTETVPTPPALSEDLREVAIAAVLNAARFEGADSPVDYGDAEQIADAVIAALARAQEQAS